MDPNANNKPVVPLLGDHNFIDWSPLFGASVNIRGWGAAFEDPKGEPTNAHLMAKDYLLFCVEKQFRDIVKDADTLQQALDELKKLHLGGLKIRRSELHRELHTLKKEAGESIIQYVSRAKRLISELRSVGEEVTDTAFYTALLEGLPGEYGSVREQLDWQLDSADEKSVSLDQIRTAMLRQEQRVKLQVDKEMVSTGTAFHARAVAGSGGAVSRGAAGRGGGRRCYRCNGFGHISSDCQNTAGEIEFLKERLEELNGKGPCSHCHEMGHYSDSCPKKHQGRSVAF